MGFTQQIISVKNLTKRYEGTEALKDVNFSVNEGEVFCILGPNGAGKTTLMKILTAQLKPSSGMVEVLGVPVENLLFSELRHQIALVPQEHAVWPDLTTLENLELIAESYRLKKEERNQKIQELLQTFELEEHAKKLVKKLSGGQQRKLAISMSLLHDPKLLFLDEPTAGLDVQARNVLLANLKALRRRGLTIIFTTHLMEEAEYLADRVLLLDEGQVIALDETKALVEQTCGKEIIEVLVDEEYVNDFASFLEKHDQDVRHVKLGMKHLISGSNVSSIGEMIMKSTELKNGIISLTLRKPTLNDAFVFLTTKEFTAE